MEGEMAERSNGGIKRWMGFKEEESSLDAQTPAAGGALARIRELESQLNELRSRRDITALTKEEFEILATETAMTLIRTAQQREAKAKAAAERLLSESKRSAQSAIESAESKAKSLLSQAESRGRRLIEAAEADAREALEAAQAKGEEFFNTKRREAASITTAAKREAEQLIAEAKSEVTSFRQWLDEAIAHAQRLYKVQVQSLDAATQAIEQSKSRLDGAWERFAKVGQAIDSSLDEEGRPRSTRPAGVVSGGASSATSGTSGGATVGSPSRNASAARKVAASRSKSPSQKRSTTRKK